jgi:hypothetical protein
MVKSSSPTAEWRRGASEFPPGKWPETKEKVRERLGRVKESLAQRR